MVTNARGKIGKMGKICIVLALIVIILLIKWILYINSLKENDIYSYSIEDFYYMGTSTDGTSMCIVNGEDWGLSNSLVSKDTLVYDKYVHEYWDFPLLWHDYACLDLEVHFVNVDTREEEIYKFKPFSFMPSRTKGRMICACNFYIENGERKVFYRYIKQEDGEQNTYYAYIYNFDTCAIETKYESTDMHSSEFVDMAKVVQTAMGRKSGGIFHALNIKANRGITDLSDPESWDYTFLYSGLEYCPGERIMISANFLPKENEKLYALFPELKQYADDNSKNIITLFFPENTNGEELAKLFIEDGHTLSYEDAHISSKYSVDGERHEISSYDEFLEYWDEEKYLNEYLDVIIWPSTLW